MSSTSVSQQYSAFLTAAEASYTDLKSALRKLKIRSELLRYSTGLLSWLASVSLLLIGWFLLGGILELPVVLRVPITAIWVGCAVWAGYVFVVRTLIKHTSIEQMAFHVEQRHPELQDRLISSLQLWPELPENKYGYSTNFIARVVEEASDALLRIDRSEVLAGEERHFKRAGLAMIGVLLPLFIIIALFPATFGDSLYAFVHPFEGIGYTVPIEITSVVPGDCTLQPGDDVDISVDVTGPALPTALLYHRTEKGKWRTMSLSGKEESADDEKSPQPPFQRGGKGVVPPFQRGDEEGEY